MHIRSALAASALTVILASCASNDMQTTGTSYVPAASIAIHDTYNWSPKRTLTLRDPSLNTDSIKGWIDQAVDEELRSKGYIKTSGGGTSDLVVTYAAGSRTIPGSREYTARGEWSGSRLDEEGGVGVILAPSRTLSTDYEEGRLNLDIIDRKSGKTVYRGSATIEMLKQPSPDKSISRINRMAKAMLRDFPRR